MRKKKVIPDEGFDELTASTAEGRVEVENFTRALLLRMIKDGEMQTPSHESDAVFLAITSLLRVACNVDMNTREYMMVSAERVFAGEMEALFLTMGDLTNRMIDESRGEARR